VVGALKQVAAAMLSAVARALAFLENAIQLILRPVTTSISNSLSAYGAEVNAAFASAVTQYSDTGSVSGPVTAKFYSAMIAEPMDFVFCLAIAAAVAITVVSLITADSEGFVGDAISEMLEGPNDAAGAIEYPLTTAGSSSFGSWVLVAASSVLSGLGLEGYALSTDESDTLGYLVGVGLGGGSFFGGLTAWAIASKLYNKQLSAFPLDVASLVFGALALLTALIQHDYNGGALFGFLTFVWIALEIYSLTESESPWYLTAAGPGDQLLGVSGLLGAVLSVASFLVLVS
jgi:hypothetical protein